MTFALEIVLPIFAFVLLGWGLAATRMLGALVGEGLAAFAAVVGIPALLFRTIVTADLGAASPWTLWACYFPAAGVAWGLGHLATRHLFGRDARTAVIGGVGSAFANTAFVGLPLAQKAYGDHGALVVTLLIAVHLPVMMTASTVMMSRAEGEIGPSASLFGALGRVGNVLIRNPIVIGIVAGLLTRALGLPLVGVPGQTIRSLADAAGPLALVSLGMAMHGHSFRGDVAATLVVSALKLVVMPGLVLVTCRLAGVDAATTGPLVVLAGVPAGINVYLIATQYGVGQRLGSSVVTLTTTLGVFTSTAWLTWLNGP